MQRKADTIAEDLIARIVRGDVAVGAVLPREDELAERYEVHRGAVREAIKQLEVHRLVRPVRRRGTVVLDPITSLSADVIRQMLCPAPGEVDAAMLSQLLELRALIDIEMNRLAARRRTEADLEELRTMLAEISARRFSPRDFGRLISELALKIARASGNCLFEMLVHWHRRIYETLEDLFMQVRPPSDAYLQGLTTLIDAIGRRDETLAADIAAMFHQWASERLLDAVDTNRGDRS